jgi:hypothetical protein
MSVTGSPPVSDQVAPVAPLRAAAVNRQPRTTGAAKLACLDGLSALRRRARPVDADVNEPVYGNIDLSDDGRDKCITRLA